MTSAGDENAAKPPQPATTEPTAAGGGRPENDPDDVTLIWTFCKTVVRIFSWLWFDLKTYGKEHVPAEGGVLLIANHQSYLDPILVACQLRRPVSFFAKSELFENKYFGGLIRNLHAFPVRQGAGDIGAVREAVARLKEGHVLNVFPEGSRTEDGELLPIQSGVALLVRKSGVPIVPVIVDGSYAAWPKGTKLPRPTPIKVLYGPPLQTEGLKGDAIVQLIDQTFRRMIEEIKKY